VSDLEEAFGVFFLEDAFLGATLGFSMGFYTGYSVFSSTLGTALDSTIGFSTDFFSGSGSVSLLDLLDLASLGLDWLLD